MSRISDEDAYEAWAAVQEHGSERKASKALGVVQSCVHKRAKIAAERGLLGTKPVLPGFALSKTTAVTDRDGAVVREFIQQRPEHGEVFEVPDGHAVKGVSALIDSDGRTIQRWVKTNQQQIAVESSIRAVVEELKAELPRVKPTTGPLYHNDQLANQFTVTDLHLSMMAWREETGGADWDLKIAEKLLVDWFSTAIALSPNAKLAILAQIGDFLHHDSHESVTPAHRHVLDADSRLQKVIRVAIRVVRQIISMLLQKHENVHVVMASGNHDPASSAWLRELLAAMYEDEPRVTVDNSPDIYYVYEHGKTGLFYHHGHKRNVERVADVFAGKFREIYGRCLQCYGHIGHLHSDAVVEGNLMKVERHRTLAPPDAHAGNGGWISGRDAKVITYHKLFGEVGRQIISPRMIAANDNAALLSAAA